MHLLRDEFAEARQTAQRLVKGASPNVRFIGYMPLVYADLLQGRTAEARRLLDKAAADQGPAGSSQSAIARTVMAEISLAHQRQGEAAAEAQRAIAESRRGVSILEALFQGSLAGSAAARAEYTRIADALPFGSDKVLPELADAIVAFEAGRHAEALPVIQRVVAQLPPGVVAPGALVAVRQPRTVANYWTGRAQLAAGNDSAAAAAFDRVATAGYARMFSPIEYVRSLYYLGVIAERQGDRAKAREYYGRFLNYWKDGDIDRDKVAEALKKTQ
jgi:tetratricopeptide (TPR) repeat protein